MKQDAGNDQSDHTKSKSIDRHKKCIPGSSQPKGTKN
jgi:hypothetical protein